MSDLAVEITEYLAGERKPFTLSGTELAGLIFWEATHNRMWSQKTLPEWERAAHEAVSRGLIESRNGKLGVVAKAKETAPQQLGLFE